MLSLLFTRALLLALPFAAYFLWRAVEKRRGKALAAPPWLSLVTIGFALVGVSLLATTLFARDTREMTYVPAETQADGSVRPDRFAPKEDR